MFPQNSPPKPTDGRPKEEERQFDLLTAYRVMIRSYLRRHTMRKPTSLVNNDEVNHGK